MYKSCLAVTDHETELPRIYATFAEFERDERRRLGLDALPAPVPADPPTDLARAIIPAPRPIPARRPALSVAITHATPEAIASLRSEGVLEIGCATETSVLFVRTRAKLHLLHATWLPDRELDDYAVDLAVTWIEGHGLPSCEVAKNLGVSETTLRRALAAAGYARLSPEQNRQRSHARSARKLGNRRGRLVRSAPEEISP